MIESENADLNDARGRKLPIWGENTKMRNRVVKSVSAGSSKVVNEFVWVAKGFRVRTRDLKRGEWCKDDI